MSYKIVIENNRIAVEEERGKYKINLNERFLQFAVDVIEYSFSLPKLREFDSIKYQLSKSATSIGANYTESQAGSFAEFKQRIQICLREARETYYWLRLFTETKVVPPKRLKELVEESNELVAILTTIVKNARIPD